MAHAFFDESGKFADSDFVCMAGYVAGDQDWEEFTGKWRALLVAHEIPYVHMKELSSITGPYRTLGWDESKRDEVLTEFLYVIREHITAGFGIAVDAKYLRTMAPDIRKKIGNPQFLCFQRMLRLMIKKLEIVGYQPAISAIFDDSEEYSIRCYKIWSKLRKKFPDISSRIPSISFADDKHFYPLQAADILAWETNNSLRKRAKGEVPREQIGILMQAPEEGFGLDYESELWGVDQLNWLASEIRSGRAQLIDDL